MPGGGSFHPAWTLPRPRPVGEGEGNRLRQIRAVTCNHLLIPPERFLTRSVQRTVARVVAVNIDKPVAFAHLARGCGHQVNAAPGGVAHQRHTVFYGIAHRTNMFAQVADTVVVINLTVFIHNVFRTEAVFHQEQRLLIAVVHHVHGDAQPQWVDTPAPFADLDVRVAQGFHDIRRIGITGVHVRRRAARGVIAERHKIDGVFQQFIVGRVFDNHHPFFAEHAGRIGRVAAARLHVDKEQVFAVFLQRHPHVFRFAGVGVEVAAGQHTADLVFRVHLMGDFGRQGACHQFVMRGLIFHLIFVLTLFKHQTRAGERAVQHDIDFVEGEPVLHQTVKFFETGTGIAGEEIDHLAVAPGSILRDQMHRYVEMAQGDQRFDVVFFALFEHCAVEGNPLFIGQWLIAVRIEAAPGNRGTKYRKAHLRHQGDVFFVAMVKINRLVARVKLVVTQRKTFFLTDLHRQTIRAVGDHIDRRQSFAAFTVSPFTLVGGKRAAP
ncbi:hypothetical protein EcWSU1_03533 [Enterobacter ludwigii]|uniref:Uncharacterized protein n=1 Tax=Enterobacter ludwigii TaxID=299767 RepID=G8LPN6_9ENTR|nr:hypothetical protein EcWSU1_03533 [Enterobacter ludwigii]